MTKPSYKGLALSSSSIRVFEDCIHREKKDKSISLSCTSSDHKNQDRINLDSEINSDIRSSKCYWEDIEPKLNEKGVILDASIPLDKDLYKFEIPNP